MSIEQLDGDVSELVELAKLAARTVKQVRQVFEAGNHPRTDSANASARPNMRYTGDYMRP